MGRLTSWRKATCKWKRILLPLHASGVFLFALALVVSACGQPASTPGGTPTTATSHAWRLISSPNPPSPTSGELLSSVLFSVSTVSPSDAWAVGASMVNDRGPQDLIEHWDGAAWHITDVPLNGVLWGVAAVSPNDVWAVGGIATASIFDSLPTNTQILHWNGMRWSRDASPDPGTKSNELQSVAVVSPNDVWAVGSYSGSDGIEHPLIERWDGTAWHVVASPAPPGPGRSVLSAITRIPGANQLWAVGTTSMSRDPNVTDDRVLVERWDGAVWHLVPSPVLPQGVQICMLRGVVALSTTEAWAVGNYGSSDQPTRPLIAHWNGTSWQMVSGLANEGDLWGIAAIGPHDVRAVGSILVIEQWDGTVWKAATRPGGASGEAGDSWLAGIASDGQSGYWAVGSYRGPEGNFQTLIERYS